MLVLAILASALTLVILFLLPETLRCRVGNGSIYASSSLLIFPPYLYSPEAPKDACSPPPRKPSLKGYWKLFRHPPIALVSINAAFLFSSYFFLAVCLASDLPATYGWSATATGGAYAAVGIAVVLGSLSGGRFSDYRRERIRVHLLRKAAVVSHQILPIVRPEVRLVDQIWGVIICAAGCAMYGWFIEKGIHPAATVVSMFMGKQPSLPANDSRCLI